MPKALFPNERLPSVIVKVGTEVTEGLKEGDRVIVEGLQKRFQAVKALKLTVTSNRQSTPPESVG